MEGDLFKCCQITGVIGHFFVCDLNIPSELLYLSDDRSSVETFSFLWNLGFWSPTTDSFLLPPNTDVSTQKSDLQVYINTVISLKVH